MVLPVRTTFTFMPRVSLPEHTRMKAMRSRWLGSMLAWILKTTPVMAFSVASTVRVAAFWLRGGGACAISASRMSRTPKFLSALPKNTGVRVPSRNLARSNLPQAVSTSAISSRQAATASTSSSVSIMGSSGPDTGWPSGSLSTWRMRGCSRS